MRAYIQYLRYLVRHIWFVRQECWRHGLLAQGLFHDLSKWRPDEFVPYARFFYAKPRRDATGYYKPTDTGDAAFDFAWLLHQKRNPHHWQWWLLPEDDGGVKVLAMPHRFRLEMVCDWVGAGKAQGFFSPPDDPYRETRAWYIKNKDKMQLHPDTRRWVEWWIGVEPHEGVHRTGS